MNNLRYIPVNGAFSHCFEAIFANTAVWNKRRYELMYIDEWDFKFNLLEKNVKNRLGNSLDSFVKLSDPLYKYHGIEFLQYHCPDKDSLLDIIGFQTAKFPITVKMDVFYCPWDKSYGKYHNENHVFFITGINHQQEILYCTDPFYKIHGQTITFGNFFKGYTGDYGIFEFHDYDEDIDGRRLVEEKLTSLLDMNIFHAIRSFAGELNKLENLSDELYGYNAPWQTPLFRNLLRIINGRQAIPILFEFIANNCGYNELSQVLNGLGEIGSKWMEIKNALIKMMASKDVGFARYLSKLLCEAAEDEERLVRKLLALD